MKITQKQKQIVDVLVIMVVLLAVGLTLVFGKIISSKITDNLLESDAVQESKENTTIHTALAKLNGIFNIIDNGILFLLFGMTITLLVTSWLIPTHPIFFIFNIVGLILLVFISAILSNTYGSFLDSTFVQDYLLSHGLTYVSEHTEYILSKLPWVCTFIVMISTVVMYGRYREGLQLGGIQ